MPLWSTAHRFLRGRPAVALVLLSAWVAAGLVLAALWMSGVHLPVRTFALAPSQISPELGCAYKVRMPRRPLGWPLVELVGDSHGSVASRLVLTEDGMPMTASHARHDDLRYAAPGGYSHWGRHLYFSAADCSDPRTNGRSYAVSVPPRLSWVSYAIVLAIWGALGWRLAEGCRHGDGEPSLCSAFQSLGYSLYRPLDLRRRPGLVIGLGVGLTLVCWCILASVWSEARSIGLAVAGFFPISDASGYWTCANSLIDNGHFGYPPVTGQWCTRRAIYPTLLAGLDLIGGRHLLTTLLAQAAIVAGAMVVLVRRVSPRIPAAATFIFAGLLVGYAADELLAATMTENAGLAFGCIGLAMLLRAADERSLSWAAGGAALLSVALNARAGAFFTLPALVLWAGLIARFYGLGVGRWVLGVGSATLAGFALQGVLVLAVGGDPGTTHGNFSYTLYGLSVGGKGWQQALVDHPELLTGGSEAERAHAAFELAWQNIRTNPALLWDGLSQNIALYVASGTYGFYRLGPPAGLARVLWWLAWIPMLLGYREPRYLLIAMLSLGIAASAPLLIADGGPRIFAATVPIDSVQIAIGIAGVAGLLASLLGASKAPAGSAPNPGPRRRTPALETAAAAIMLAVLALPHTPLARLGTQMPVAFDACPPDQDAVATRIGRGGTVALVVAAEGQPSGLLAGRVDRQALMDGSVGGSWWRRDLLAFDGRAFMQATQLRPDDPTRPGPYRLYTNLDLSGYDGTLVGLCLDRTEARRMFGEPYRKLQSMTPLE